MSVIGLTGGIHCGKTTTLSLFKQEGFKTISCDVIAHELLQKHEIVRQALQERWGKAILNKEGFLDKKHIANIVFTNETERIWLEDILHPLVRKIWTSRVFAEPELDWIVEIPLLFEKKIETLLNCSICVISSLALQLSRLAATGLTEQQACARIGQQWPLSKKMENADFVLLNNGTLAFLHQQILSLIKYIKDK